MPSTLLDISTGHRPLLLVTALPFETQVLVRQDKNWRLVKSQGVRVYHHRSDEIVVFQTGAGFRQGREQLVSLLKELKPVLVVNLGIAGALDLTTELFAAFLIEEVYFETGERFDLRSLLPEMLQNDRRPFPGARLLTVSEPVLDPDRRETLYHRFGCPLVDMEAFPLAQQIFSHKTRAVFLKVVSDFADQQAVEQVKAQVPFLQRRLHQAVVRLFASLGNQ